MFSGSSDSQVSLKIFNFLGNQVYQEVLGMIPQDQTIKVNVSGLPEGIYFFAASCDEQLIGRGQFRIDR
jgi:hypothetical protein